MNVKDYPLKANLNVVQDDQVATRAMTKRTPIEMGSTNLKSKTCVSDAIKLWNTASTTIHNCINLYSIKKCTKLYVKTLPTKSKNKKTLICHNS